MADKPIHACATCAKPKEKWTQEGVTVKGVEYCCIGCAKDSGCECSNNEYDFDNRDTGGQGNR